MGNTEPPDREGKGEDTGITDGSWRVLMPVNSTWPEPFDHGFRKPVYCGGPQLTLFCWVGRSSSLLAQQQGALWWGCLLSLPDSSLQGYFHFVAWVPPCLPHFLEDPCCLENPAPQATSGPAGMCLLAELQALPSPPESRFTETCTRTMATTVLARGTQAVPATDLLRFFSLCGS